MLSPVLLTLEVKKSQELGYRNIAQEDKKIAAILGRYAQGLPRDDAVEGYVLINGVRYQCACKAFMEYSIVDISACEFAIKSGDPMEIISDASHPFDLATTANNIPEIFFAALSHLIQYTLMELKRGHAHQKLECDWDKPNNWMWNSPSWRCLRDLEKIFFILKITMEYNFIK